MFPCAASENCSGLSCWCVWHWYSQCHFDTYLKQHLPFGLFLEELQCNPKLLGSDWSVSFPSFGLQDLLKPSITFNSIQPSLWKGLKVYFSPLLKYYTTSNWFLLAARLMTLVHIKVNFCLLRGKSSWLDVRFFCLFFAGLSIMDKVSGLNVLAMLFFFRGVAHCSKWEIQTDHISFL